MAIPARIIQTSKTRELSRIGRISATNLKLLHPSWEYQFFDDTDIRDFMNSEFSELVEVFDSYAHPIQRIDFFRYLAVYRLGGFYFDLDVLLEREIDALKTEECVFPFEELSMNEFLDRSFGMNWEIGNYAFGAAAGSPFLEQVIENCIRAQSDAHWVDPMMAGIPRALAPDFHILNTTGPGLVSRTLGENPEASIRVLMPDDIYAKANWHNFGPYGIHLMEGSWHGGRSIWRTLAWWRLCRAMRSRNSGRANGIHTPSCLAEQQG